MPREPFCQIAANAANAARMDSAASPAPRKTVDQRRPNSRNPNRMMMIDTAPATSANTARYRAPGGKHRHRFQLIGCGKPAGMWESWVNPEKRQSCGPGGRPGLKNGG